MRVFLLMFILNFFSFGIKAQITWQKIYPNSTFSQEIGSFELLPDSSMLLYGSTYNTNYENDFHAMKFNTDGTIDWQVQTNLPGTIYNVIQAQTKGGSIFVYNSYEMSIDGELEMLVTRVNDQGQMLWSKRFKNIDESEVSCMTNISNSQVLIGGNRRLNDSVEIFLLGLDTTGAIWLNKTVRVKLFTSISSIKLLSNGKLILSGITDDISSPCLFVPSNLLIAELDMNGNILNHTIIEKPQYAFNPGSQEIFWNGLDYFVCGEYSDTSSFTYRNFVMKLNSNLELKWMNSYSPFYYGFSFFQDLVFLNDGSFTGIVTYFDSTITSEMDQNFGIVNIDTSGNLNWNSDYKMKLIDVPVNIFALQNGYLIGGQVMDIITVNQTVVNDYDNFLLKTDQMGQTGCNEFEISYFTIPITDCISETEDLEYNQINWTISNLNLSFTNTNFKEEEFCSPNSIEPFESLNDKFSIYPNPAHSELTISFSDFPKEEINVELISLDGKSQLKFTIHSDLYLTDISELIPGIYFIRVSDSKESSILKFIKN